MAMRRTQVFKRVFRRQEEATFDEPRPSTSNLDVERHVIGNVETQEEHDSQSDHADGEMEQTVVQNADGRLYMIVDGEGVEVQLEENEYVVVEDGQYPMETSEDNGETDPSLHIGTKADEYQLIESRNVNDQSVGRRNNQRPMNIMAEAKKRKNRQFGNCRCPECGASFVNTNRLERHLAVHQLYGSFLCPLCGKTFKYEYNLFYHWRKVCKDLDDIICLDEREGMDVNSLRQVIDEVVAKKALVAPTEIGISRGILYQSNPLSRLEMPSHYAHGRISRGVPCIGCNVVVPPYHMSRHISVHQGNMAPDTRAASGAYFCDLCGLSYRHHDNLIKHWRTNCPEIQANLPMSDEIALDNEQLRILVVRLVKKALTIPMSQLISLNGGIRIGQHDEANEMASTSRSSYISATTSLSQDRASAGHSGVSESVVYADDFPEPEEAGRVHLTAGAARAKWAGTPGGVQCPECFRMFANMGRLDRHLAGFHSSYGTFHCILCGNRFKYEYNLLFHYRKSCPYTKAFIDKDVRDQMDAQSLRKVVRQLAEKEVTISSTLKMDPQVALEESMVVKASIKKPPMVLSSFPRESIKLKPGIEASATPCPVCGVVFYGRNIVDRHIQAVHDMEPRTAYAIHAADVEIEERREAPAVNRVQRNRRHSQHSKSDAADQEKYDAPPILVPEEPCEQPPVLMKNEDNLLPQSSRLPKVSRIVDENGDPLSGVDDAQMEELLKLANDLNVDDQVVIRDPNGDQVFYQISEVRCTGDEDKVIVMVIATFGYDDDIDVDRASSTVSVNGEEVFIEEQVETEDMFGEHLLDP